MPSSFEPSRLNLVSLSMPSSVCLRMSSREARADFRNAFLIVRPPRAGSSSAPRPAEGKGDVHLCQRIFEATVDRSLHARAWSVHDAETPAIGDGGALQISR